MGSALERPFRKKKVVSTRTDRTFPHVDSTLSSTTICIIPCLGTETDAPIEAWIGRPGWRFGKLEWGDAEEYHHRAQVGGLFWGYHDPR